MTPLHLLVQHLSPDMLTALKAAIATVCRPHAHLPIPASYVCVCVKANERTPAIAAYRAQTSCGLKEAKEVVEWLFARRENWTPVSTWLHADADAALTGAAATFERLYKERT